MNSSAKNKIKTILKNTLPEGAFSYLKRLNVSRHAFVQKYQGYFDEYTARKMQKFYAKIVANLKIKARKTGKIRVGFFVVRDSQFSGRPLFEKMLCHPVFEPKIILAPETEAYHAPKDIPTYYECAFKRLASQYGEDNIVNSFSITRQRFINTVKDFDIFAFSEPYVHGDNKIYSIENFIKNKKLVFYNAYGYEGKIQYDIDILNLYYQFSKYWLHFVDNKEEIELCKKNKNCFCKNMIVSGSCKMDKYFSVEQNTARPNKKTILLSPHHSILPEKLTQTGNFFSYYNFYLELPKKYPEINFIFRPHPALWPTLRNFDDWGTKRVDEYIKQIKSMPNVEYSDGGEYFDLFAKSDALIDDCVSWFAEYFYTQKPQCYILRDEGELYTQYLEFGREFFNHVYKAFNENDIIDFIENVVLGKNDPKAEGRKEFARERVMINYPHVSDFIIDYFENVFEIKDLVKNRN